MNTLFGCLYWLRIFLSPVAISLMVAGPLFFFYSSPLTDLLAGGLLLAGIIIGIVFAERMRAKYGTMAFMGKIYGTDDVNRRVD